MAANWLDDLPSGYSELGNLTRKELQGLPPAKLVDIIGWQRQIVDALNDQLQQSETESRSLRALANRLSVDSKTGILTMAAVNVLGNILFDSNIMPILKERGYTLRICFLDVDELRRHNTLGGHEGGDTVLVEVAKRLKILYRRKSDVIAAGMLDFLNKARYSVPGNGEALVGEGGFERGDEMIAWRYSPSTENDVRRNGWTLTREVARIKKGFDGASVSYPLVEGLSKKDLQKIDPEGRFKTESGIVTAPVSVTFACIYAPMPVNRREARRITRSANELVVASKVKRGSSTPQGSEGVSLALTDEDLI